MRTRTVTERIGEDMGPIDWSYDFAQHFTSHQANRREEALAQALAWLRDLEADPSAYRATTDGGWPRFGWHDVIKVCMYDGWPYWRPVPSVLVAGTLGGEWHCFSMLTGVEKKGRAA